MRLALIGDIDSRDGTANKDARLVNVLGEPDEGVTYAAIRPSLESVSSNTGNGNGLTRFNGALISVFGTTLGTGSSPSSVGTVADGHYDFAAGPL